MVPDILPEILPGMVPNTLPGMVQDILPDMVLDMVQDILPRKLLRNFFFGNISGTCSMKSW